ncbi:hypothetical protein ACFV0H_40920 [Streptomyces erythrochromogenes]|uniref:hypothetical protein n=1 Tax=Streptomyces erythrochromogenes TaxID=285574 RepID=UPI003683F58F
MSPDAFWKAFEILGLERPAADTVIKDLDAVEQLLFSVALAYAQRTDSLAVADVDGIFSPDDRRHVRQALSEIASQGTSVLATSAELGWGTVDIPLDPEPGTFSEKNTRSTEFDEPDKVQDRKNGNSIRRWLRLRDRTPPVPAAIESSTPPMFRYDFPDPDDPYAEAKHSDPALQAGGSLPRGNPQAGRSYLSKPTMHPGGQCANERSHSQANGPLRHSNAVDAYAPALDGETP